MLDLSVLNTFKAQQYMFVDWRGWSKTSDTIKSDTVRRETVLHLLCAVVADKGCKINWLTVWGNRERYGHGEMTLWGNRERYGHGEMTLWGNREGGMDKEI